MFICTRFNERLLLLLLSLFLVHTSGQSICTCDDRLKTMVDDGTSVQQFYVCLCTEKCVIRRNDRSKEAYNGVS